jgi:hypothetical protein
MWDFLPLEKAGTCRKHGERIFVLRSHPWRYLCADCDLELYGLTSEHMTYEKQDQQRADRNHERTEEAHWQVAEAGAEEEKRQPEARPADEHEEDWENEGGALGPEPRKTDEPNDENL